MEVGKTFQGVTGKHAKAATVVRYFSRTVEIFINEAVEHRIRGRGNPQALQGISNRVKNIRISPNLHGYIGDAVACRICEVLPNSIKDRLVETEKSPKPVGTNKIVSEERWLGGVQAHRGIALVLVKREKLFRKFGSNDFRERPGLLQGNSFFGKK
jgi:hypothetical protein